MSSAYPGALSAFGWSERVADLYRSGAHTGPTRPGRVTRVERAAMVVIDADGAERPYRPGGMAVGDWVVIDGSEVAGMLPRWSSLARQDPDTGAEQVLAANVDLVLITVPADRPSVTRAERELVLAWESGARPVVLLTKADLAGDGLLERLTDRLAGVDVLATSIEDRTGAVEVATRLSPDLTGVLLGPSGSGKSTLTNALLGENHQATGAVRGEDGRGRHTTTSRQLLPVPGGGVIIDTPGLRSLGLVGADQLDRAFPDIEELASGCRFADCAHRREPDCAVTAAVDAGALSGPRLASYHKLVSEGAADAIRRDLLARREAGRAGRQRSRDGRRYDERRPPRD